MYTVDDLVAGAAVAGFPAMFNEVLVDCGRLAVAVAIRVRGDMAVLHLRPIPALPRGDGLLVTCPARQCVSVLRAVRRILERRRERPAGLFEEPDDA